MEVRETAACGISLREFAIEFDNDEILDVYRIFQYVEKGSGSYDKDFLDDLESQMSYIIGPSLEGPVENTIEEKIYWEDTGSSYNLTFNEMEARKLYQVLLAVKHPGEGFDKELLQKLIGQIMEMVPGAIGNLH